MSVVQKNANAFRVAGLLLLLAGIQLWIARDFVVDDAYISLRYAQRLADGKGLTWNDQERVEGYSNLLWVVSASPLLKLGIHPLTTARILGVTCTAATFLLFACYYHASLRSVWPVFGGLVLSIPVMAWSLGGMEPPLQAFGVVLLTMAYLKSVEHSFEHIRFLLLASIALIVLVLTRADGFVLLVPVTFLLVYHSMHLDWRHRVRVLSIVALPVVLVVATHFYIRYAYYGDWLPNTARIKMPVGASLWFDGVKYVGKWILFSLPFSIASGVSLYALWRQSRSRRTAEAILIIGGFYAAYLVYIGGDFFPAFRHVVPLVWLGAIAQAEVLRRVSWRIPNYKWFQTGFAALLLVYWLLQQATPMNRWIKSSYIEWYQAESLSEALRTAFEARQPTIAVTAAGSFPLFTGFPSIDMLGLNDRYIATHPTHHFGKVTEMGHAYGNGPYVLSRKPDMIIFSIGEYDPNFLYAYEFGEGDSTFFRQYYPVLICGDTPVNKCGIVWFRKHSRRLGKTMSDNSLHIPLYSILQDTVRFRAENGALWRWCAPGDRLVVTASELPNELPPLFIPASFLFDSSSVHTPYRTILYTGVQPIRIHELVITKEAMCIQ